MSIALVISGIRSNDWKTEILNLLPGTKVEIYPHIEDFKTVDFILAWKPDQGYHNQFPNLKVIQSAGAGVDHLYLDLLPEQVTICKIVDPMLQKDMLEHVLTCILSSMKNFPDYFLDKFLKRWRPQKYQTIEDVTVTVLGLGKIGSYVAAGLVRFGFNVRGWSSSPKDLEGITCFSGEGSLYESIRDADFIINILPLTADTRGILNGYFFQACGPGTVLLNVGRGGHVVDRDLLEAMDGGNIKAAYLDVFQHEPLPEEHPFWQAKNLFLTPHVASRTNIKSSVGQVVENYKRMMHNQPLLNEVSRKKGY